MQIAFKMMLHAGCQAEYKKRHAEIWPEMILLLKSKGVYDYSIFHDPETNCLFAVYKINDTGSLESTAAEPILRRWWDQMADIMEVHDDNSPIIKPLQQVFYMP